MPGSLLRLLAPAALLVACGTDDPAEVHFTYVASQASLPTSTAEATEFGLDLDGDKVVDNLLGSVLAALSGQGVDVQTAVARAIDRGDLLLLLDLATPSLSSSRHAGLQVRLGDEATATPAPCADPGDAICRRHLDGTGAFTVAAGSPDPPALVGDVIDGIFRGGPGDLSLEVPLLALPVVQLDLIGGRARASGLAEAAIESVVLAGALTQDELDDKVIRTIHAQVVVPTVAADCPDTTPPDCGCAPGSTGKTLLVVFDISPKDCTVTLDEILHSPLIERLDPDVTIDGAPAFSFGMKLSAVRAAIR